MTLARMFVVIVVLAPHLLAVEPTPPNFAGTWIVDLDSSRADSRDLKFSVVIIEQEGPRVQFDFFHGERPLGTEIFIAGGPARERYRTRVETATAQAKFRKNALEIWTLHTQRHIVADMSFTETESWAISEDGNTLNHTFRDGTFLVYGRQAPTKE